jgi:hypothetical protein
MLLLWTCSQQMTLWQALRLLDNPREPGVPKQTKETDSTAWKWRVVPSSRNLWEAFKIFFFWTANSWHFPFGGDRQPQIISFISYNASTEDFDTILVSHCRNTRQVSVSRAILNSSRMPQTSHPLLKKWTEAVVISSVLLNSYRFWNGILENCTVWSFYQRIEFGIGSPCDTIIEFSGSLPSNLIPLAEMITQIWFHLMNIWCRTFCHVQLVLKIFAKCGVCGWVKMELFTLLLHPPYCKAYERDFTSLGANVCSVAKESWFLAKQIVWFLMKWD